MSEQEHIYRVHCTRTCYESMTIHSPNKLTEDQVKKQARDNSQNFETGDSEEEEMSVVEMVKRKDGGLDEKRD